MVKIEELVRRSGAAVCAPSERETIVKRHNLGKAIGAIKSSGSHMFIGSGPGPSSKTSKVWFIRRGSL